MRMTRLLAVLAAGVILTAVQIGQGATVKIGSPAPALQVAKWAQGEAVKGFEKDKVYMVEFWATWCGPCVASIPHVNELHKKFKDKGFVVIGQNVWEEDEGEIPKFMKRMGDKMTYRVALDDKSKIKKGAMAQTWMEAAGQNGIPAAFLVDKNGKIAWIGHPMTLKEQTIEQLLAGTFDIKKAAADQEAESQREEMLEGLRKQLADAVKGSKWDDAEAALAAMEKVDDEEVRREAGFTRVRVSLEKKDTAAAEKAALALGEKNSDNAMLHDGIAWALVTYEKPTESMLATAEKLISHANTLTKNENANILDTMARVQFLKGEKETAVATQEKAVSFAQAGRQKDHYTRNLNLYKKGELPEE